jgi:hypothetical protein
VVRSLVVTVALAGCFSPAPHAGVPCSASGECPAGLVCDMSTNRCERSASEVDASPTTDGPMIDMASIDGSIDAPIDAPPPEPFVAEYLFDDSLEDENGSHDASAVGSDFTYLNGRDGATDKAVRIGTTLTSYLRIADSPDFDIPKGTIELWFRFDGTVPAGDLGLLSRDANASATNGHVNVRLSHDRRIVVRIQKMSTPTIEAYRCTSAAVATNVWHHVVIAFGGSLAVEVDGVVADGTSWTDTQSIAHDCTAAWSTGIDGNDNPWIVGALTVQATEGTGAPVNAIAGGVQIDELVIRSVP